MQKSTKDYLSNPENLIQTNYHSNIHQNFQIYVDPHNNQNPEPNKYDNNFELNKAGSIFNYLGLPNN